MSFVAKENMILGAFLLLVIDRGVALYFVREKAAKVLDKFPNGKRVPERLIVQWYFDEFLPILAQSALAIFILVSFVQLTDRPSLSNDFGRLVFAVISFMLSVGGTVVNICIEKVDRRA